MKTQDTFVLIVGGGPVGLSAAIDLGTRGIPAILIADTLVTAQHPKCNLTNARSLEHFRRMGVAADIRRHGLPKDYPRENAYVTRYCGLEFARHVRPPARPQKAGEPGPVPLTAEPAHVVSQIFLEPVLRAAAERQASVEIAFGWRLVEFEELSEGVIAVAEHVVSGDRRRIAAQYAIGADGARSFLRRRLGIGLSGLDGSEERAFMAGTMMSFFVRAPDLLQASGRRPAIINWILNRDIRGFVFAQDGKELWIFHYQARRGIDWTTLDQRATVQAMIGADIPFEILSAGPWTGGLALVAERYRQGRVFLAGDAAHLFTPLGGLGMNTGIGDVVNLCWKLAAVYEGWAGAALLDTYEIERRPMAQRNCQVGIRSAQRLGNWRVPDDIESEVADAVAMRQAFGEFCVHDDVDQYNTTGIQLGERYEASPIIVADGDAPPPDDWQIYRPVVRAGARLPHAWLEDGRALFDVVGPGLTLLTCAETDAAEPFTADSRRKGVPLRVVDLPAGLLPMTASKLILLRSDHHVVWHGASAPVGTPALIDRARGAA